MFTFSDPAVDDTVVSSMPRDEVATTAATMLREARAREARTVLLATRLALDTYDDVINGVYGVTSSHSHTKADKVATGEVSLQLGVSRTKAGEWIKLGESLAAYPKVRHAYLAGHYSTSRVRDIVRALDVAPPSLKNQTSPTTADTEADPNADANDGAVEGDQAGDASSDETVTDEEATTDDADADNDAVITDDAPTEPEVDLEDLMIDLANRPTTDPVLRDQLEELVITLDPDAAEESRQEFSERWQNVKFTTDSNGHMSIDIEMSAAQGVHLQNRIRDLIATRVCKHDRRPIGTKRVVALGEITGFPGARLVCQCGIPGCPATPPPPDPEDPQAPDDTNGPDTGGPDAGGPDTDGPDGNDGPDGTEGPDSGDGGEAPEASETVDGPADGPQTPEPTEPQPDSPEPAAGPAAPQPQPSRDVEPESAEPAAPTEPEPTGLTVTVDPTGTQLPRLRGYGAITPAFAAQLHRQHLATIVLREPRPPDPPPDPSRPRGAPPPGALTYQPSRRLREEIYATDHYCRYPYCDRPAELCELDHLQPFDQKHPVDGGWTVRENLIPLCTPDHHRKHFGLWLPRMGENRTVIWRNPTTGQTITTWPR